MIWSLSDFKGRAGRLKTAPCRFAGTLHETTANRDLDCHGGLTYLKKKQVCRVTGACRYMIYPINKILDKYQKGIITFKIIIKESTVQYTVREKTYCCNDRFNKMFKYANLRKIILREITHLQKITNFFLKSVKSKYDKLPTPPGKRTNIYFDCLWHTKLG
jgi:hypothetical protein